MDNLAKTGGEDSGRGAKPQLRAAFDQDYYEQTIRTNGYDRLDFHAIDFSLGSLTNADLRQRWLCHHLGHGFLSRFNAHQPSQVITGIGMSGPPHLGTVAQLLRAIILQQASLRVEVVLGDLDAYNARKKPLDQVRNLAARYRDFAISIGFDPTRGCLRAQSDSPEVALEAAALARYALDDDFIEAEERIIRDIYEKEGVYRGINFPIKYAMLLMSADITHFRNNGTRNILVMTGLEEHKYIRLAQHLVRSIDPNVHVAGMYSRVLPGLGGYPKMSKSIPQSGIHAGLSRDEIAGLIRSESQRRTADGLSPVLLMMAMTSPVTAKELEATRLACCSDPATWDKAVTTYIDYQCAIFAKW